MDDTAQPTLSIPSLVAFAVVSFFAIRYFFFSPASNTAGAYPGSSSSSASASRNSRRRNFPADRVDTVSTIFPQLARRDIEWDLVNNGGSVQATTARVLTGGRLPTAPRNFQPLYDTPPPSTSSNNITNTPASRQRAQQHQDLITRYNLAARIAAGQEGPAPTGDEEIQTKEKQMQKGGWSANKVDRQALLKKRREDMIMAARRKMEEKERQDVKGKGRAE